MLPNTCFGNALALCLSGSPVVQRCVYGSNTEVARLTGSERAPRERPFPVSCFTDIAIIRKRVIGLWLPAFALPHSGKNGRHGLDFQNEGEGGIRITEIFVTIRDKLFSTRPNSIKLTR